MLALFLPLSACHFYFGGDDEPDPCDYDYDYDRGVPVDFEEDAPLRLRDPQSGACLEFHTGTGYPDNPYPCNAACGECPAIGGAVEPSPGTGTDSGTGADEAPSGTSQAPLPSWGGCESYCTNLGEEGCLATDGCRGIYGAKGDGPVEFQQCWQTDQYYNGGPAECEGLDAHSCSTYDDCTAVHTLNCADPGDDSFQEVPCDVGGFVSCQNEESTDLGCYGDEECADGFHCNAAEACEAPPGSGACPDDQCDAPSVCYGQCVPDNRGECQGEVICRSLPPVCADDSTPGIENGCWTGSCIPLTSCPVVECGAIATESLCISRVDCTPYYEGVDCDCTPEGCSCSEWQFDTCAVAAP